MKQHIKVIVQSPDKIKAGQFREELRRNIEVDDALNFDFTTLLKGLRLMFFNKEIFINLTIM